MSGIANDRILRDGMRGLCLSLNAVASWLPSQLDNLALWMRADEGAATSGSRGFASASSRHFSIADNASLSLGGDIEFAIAVWVYFDTLSGTVGVVSKDATGGQRGIDLRWISGTGLQFAVSTDGSTIQAVTSSETLTAGQWYFICGWRESQTLYISVNNGAPDSIAHSTTFDNNAAFVLGARLGGSSGFLDGQLSRFGFRKGSAWSASERTELFNNGNALTHGALSSALKTDLVSYLNLNEASGNAIDAHGSNDFTAVNAPTAAAGPAVMTAADSSGNENNGDLVGFGGSEATAWKSDTPSGEGRSLLLDGVNNYVKVADDPSLNITTDVSVRVIVKPTDVTGIQQLILKGVTAGSGYGYGIRTNGAKLQYLWASSGANILESDDNHLVAGQWSEITVTHVSGAEPTIYVDGVAVDATMTVGSSSNPLTSTSNPLGIGAEGGGVNPTAGLIDDVRIYDAELTASEVLDPTDTNLQGHWKFDDGPQEVGAVGDGDPVTQWESREGNRRTYAISGTGAQPIYKESGINGQPALEFTNDDLLKSSDVSTANLGHQTWVVKPQGAFTEDHVVWSSADESTANNYIMGGIDSTGKVFLEFNDGGTIYRVTGDTVLSIDSDYVIAWKRTSGGTWAIDVNGTAQTLTVINANIGKWFDDVSGADNHVIGALVHTSETKHFNGRIAEAIQYDDELTGDEESVLESYTNDRYGVAA